MLQVLFTLGDQPSHFAEQMDYRGHFDKSYKLEPSLFRKDKDGNFLYLNNEHVLYRELLIANSIDFLSDESTLDDVVQ